MASQRLTSTLDVPPVWGADGREPEVIVYTPRHGPKIREKRPPEKVMPADERERRARLWQMSRKQDTEVRCGDVWKPGFETWGIL